MPACLTKFKLLFKRIFYSTFHHNVKLSGRESVGFIEIKEEKSLMKFPKLLTK